MKHRMRFIRLVLLILIASLLAGCSQSTGGQQTTTKPTSPLAAVEAVKALRKIEAATQVSVNYFQYSQLVVDAKAQVNEASATLPDGELKKEINAAMDAYADVGLIWREQVEGARNLYVDLPPGKTLIPKYSLEGQARDIVRAQKIILESGRSHLNRASILLQQ
jgi:ABC-type glycerol-3-phosphate transport system substrate-binding protein